MQNGYAILIMDSKHLLTALEMRAGQNAYLSIRASREDAEKIGEQFVEQFPEDVVSFQVVEVKAFPWQIAR